MIDVGPTEIERGRKVVHQLKTTWGVQGGQKFMEGRFCIECSYQQLPEAINAS